MSKISGKNTSTEIIVRKLVHSLGFRFRLHRKNLPGKPDLVFPKYKKVIFVHGCFWHGHNNCKRSKLPKTNLKFWNDKILNNIIRDNNNIKNLYFLGWQTLVIWQCEITKKNIVKLENKIINFLNIK